MAKLNAIKFMFQMLQCINKVKDRLMSRWRGGKMGGRADK